jgi:hypothetical protein
LLLWFQPAILQFVTFGGLVFIMHVRIDRRLTDGFKRTLLLGKKRLACDTAREATSDQVKELKAEARQLDAGRGPDRKPTAQKNACGGEN